MRTDQSDPRPQIGAIAIACATWALAAWLTTQSSLFDRDEPRFARAAVEMLSRHDWLVPTFEGELRPDKPILWYWLGALSMQLFGATAWAARAASPIALAATSYVVFRAGHELFGARVGRWAQLVFVLTPLPLVEGSLATADALLLLFTTVATWRGMVMLTRRARPRDVLIVGGALGLGLLSKGPVALVIPIAAWITTRWIARRSDPALAPSRMISHAAASAIAIALFLAWAIPANAATGGEFARRGLGHHVLDRSLAPMEGHGGAFFWSLPFYLPVIVLGSLPWTPFVLGGAALLASAPSRPANSPSLPAWPRAVLLGWIVPCVVILSLVATKLPHYILPAWPGIAIAIAVHLLRADEGVLDAQERAWLRRGVWLHAAIVLTIAAVMWFAPERLGIPSARAAFCVVAILWIGAGALALAFGARRRPLRAAASLAVGALLSWTWIGFAIVPEFERTKPAARTARAIVARVEPSTPIATFRYHEPSLDFGLGERPVTRLAQDDALRAWMNGVGPRAIVLPASELERALAAAPSGAWREIARESGFDVSKGRAFELVVLAR